MANQSLYANDAKAICDAFFNELADAAAGKKTSLPFIRNELPNRPVVAEGQIFQAMVVGGTMFKCARLQKTKDGLSILSQSESALPVFDTKDVFLKFLKDALEPDVTAVAISFAYPVTPLFSGVLDGRLLFATKEHTFDGLVGQVIGLTVSRYIAETTGRQVTVSVANDTVCLLMAGLTKYPWQQLAAGIVGTGMNFALFTDQTQVINLEAASFSNFAPSPAGQAVDQHSSRPGEQLFEKEIAGKYLGDHFTYLMTAAGYSQPSVDTKVLSKLAEGTDATAQIAQAVFHHSAQYVAAAAASLANFGSKPSVFVMQGSLFWNGYHYKEMVADEVKNLLGPNRSLEFVHIDNADILGAAKLIA